MNTITLLDCTLRDGGYVNDWKWGNAQIKDIIQSLTFAGVDAVEVGFLRNIDVFDSGVSVANTIEELNTFLPARSNGEHTKHTMYSAMAMRSNYDIDKLTPYCGSGIEMIRVTAHEYDIQEGLDFALQVKEKGYKVAINPINIMGYTDAQVLWIVEQVNKICPYQFTIVDTFGSMKREDLDRLVSLVDHNLSKDITLGLHLHENLSTSVYLAQRFLEKNLQRDIAIDASLMGMGRIPGNLPIELIADFMIDFSHKKYDLDLMMDAIQDHIALYKGESNWGYTPAYFLSAKYNLHRNYAEHYLKKGDLTNKDINHILSRIDHNKKAVFDAKYADTLYESYLNNMIDDSVDYAALKHKLDGKSILVLAPGQTLVTHQNEINEYMRKNNPVVISVNCIPDLFHIDYAFFSNHRRYEKLNNHSCPIIATSNLSGNNINYRINYNRLAGAFTQGCNSLILLLHFLKDINVGSIAIAGADGYTENGENYYLSNIKSSSPHGHAFNLEVSAAIKRLTLDISFITPTKYVL